MTKPTTLEEAVRWQAFAAEDAAEIERIRAKIAETPTHQPFERAKLRQRLIDTQSQAAGAAAMARFHLGVRV